MAGTTVSEVLLTVLLDLYEAGPLQVEAWKRGPKDVADLTWEKIQQRIGDEAAYKARMALPAATAYSPVMNPAFKSRSGLNRDQIVRKHADNVAKGYEKYLKSLSQVYETVNGTTAQRLKDSIDASAEVYSHKVAKNVLPFTGSTELGKGVAPIAAMWLSGDITTEGHLRGDDQIGMGGPVNVARVTPDMRSALKSALVNRLIQSGKILISADWDSTVMADENDHVNDLIASLQDSAYVAFATGGTSHCDWTVIDGRKYLSIKVSIP
jgi:hypothetical protein